MSDVEVWDVLKTVSILDHPAITVAMEQVRLPDGQVIPDWPTIYTRDYVNAVVFNENNEVMIIEGYQHGTGKLSWQVLSGHMDEGENPMSSVQRQLTEKTGFTTNDWAYLGSYVTDGNQHVGVGHFFRARKAILAEDVVADAIHSQKIRWIPLQEVKYGLLDGRIAVMSYAINIALALLFP